VQYIRDLKSDSKNSKEKNNNQQREREREKETWRDIRMRENKIVRARVGRERARKED
jgi:hypothetical protein